MDNVKINSSTFCPSPWIGFFNQVNIGKCCCANLIKTDKLISEHMSSNEMNKLRQALLNGEKHPTCNECWETEAQGLKSIRQQRLDYLQPDNYITADETYKGKIEFLELRVSNLCNLACRMCNPTDSSLIAKEIIDNPSIQKIYPKNFNVTNYLDEISEDRWQEILDICQNLKRLSLTGGEPMIVKKFYDLLDYLILNNFSKNIDLQITTNGTVYNQKMLDKLYQFKNVTFVLSLDATGKVAEYQRYGKSWETIYKNAIQLINQPFKHIMVHATISAYTVLDMGNFANLLLELIDKNENLRIHNYFVTNPQSLQIFNLNQDLKIIAIDQLINAADKMAGRQQLFKFKNQLLNAAQSLKLSLDIDNDKEFKSFVEYTKALDLVRNQKFEDYFHYKLY